jgi:transposase-like protein
MSNTKARRHFTGQEKVAILRRHLVEKVPVSDLCEEHGIHPTLFYRWQKDWFEQGAVVFDAPKGRARNGRSEDADAGTRAATAASDTAPPFRVEGMRLGASRTLGFFGMLLGLFAMRRAYRTSGEPVNVEGDSEPQAPARGGVINTTPSPGKRTSGPGRQTWGHDFVYEFVARRLMERHTGDRSKPVAVLIRLRAGAFGL